MLTSRIVSIVAFCTRNAWLVVISAAIVFTASVGLTVKNFALSTDINNLISPHLPWRQREIALKAAFPQQQQLILAVLEAPTPEFASQASAALVHAMSQHTKEIRAVGDTAGTPFFMRNGLLFMSVEGLARTVRPLAELEPFVSALAADPSLRGLTEALTIGLIGASFAQFTLDNMARPLNTVADSLDDVLAKRPAYFSWRQLLKGEPPTKSERRRFIQIQAALDFGELEPGRAATEAVRGEVAKLDLKSKYGATVRLTGPVPIADEEFATVKDGAFVNTLITVAVVLLILWLGLRSGRIILAVFLSLVLGLSLTAAVGLLLVGTLNLISVAFAVLFVGLGVDFGIQFSVRYRAERYGNDNLRAALSAAARGVAAPLTLAAAATAAGFLSFLPTDYRGVSELGQIAGVGMLIAFVCSITVLPAILTILNPSGEKEPLGYAALRPVDRFLERYRIAIIAGTAAVTIAGLPLLYFLKFDFNPINLRSPKVESIATYLDLRSDPQTGANSIDVIAPSMPEAIEIAERLRKVQQVARVTTLDSFVPDDQEPKLQLIQAAAAKLSPVLEELGRTSAPSDEENKAALRKAATALNQAAGSETGTGATAAKRLAATISQLINADSDMRDTAQSVLVTPLKTALDELRSWLQAKPITRESLPSKIVRDWVTADGRARVEALPKGDPNNNETLRAFARAVLAVEPRAVGGPIGILESGDTIVSAFIQAGLWAFVSITILLWITLRRFGDVLLTLIPLLVAGVVTLEICVLIGLQLNFANIIALPLLLGIGVAFKIYYVMAWRAGQTNLLQTSLTRAIIFSALTTATAFGSLWFSNHPGTSSMGKLLALSLVCTLAAAVLFQPALLGRPRAVGNT